MCDEDSIDGFFLFYEKNEPVNLLSEFLDKQEKEKLIQ